MSTVSGAIRPITLQPPPGLKLRAVAFRRRAEAQAFLALLELALCAAAEEGFVDLVAAYARAKPLYIDQTQRFAGTGAILDAIGGVAAFRDPQTQLDLYLRGESKHSDTYARLSLGGALQRPSLRVVVEWRDRRWWSPERAGAQASYDHICDLAQRGVLGRFAAGSRAQLEALAGRLEPLVPAGGKTRLELRGQIVVPGPTRLGRLRLVDFHQRPVRRTRIAKGDPAPTRLLETFHGDPYTDFVAWALFQHASHGTWAPQQGVWFARSDRAGEPLSLEGAAALGVRENDVRIEGERVLVSKGIRPYHPLEGELRAYAVPGWGGDNT